MVLKGVISVHREIHGFQCLMFSCLRLSWKWYFLQFQTLNEPKNCGFWKPCLFKNCGFWKLRLFENCAFSKTAVFETKDHLPIKVTPIFRIVASYKKRQTAVLHLVIAFACKLLRRKKLLASRVNQFFLIKNILIEP